MFLYLILPFLAAFILFTLLVAVDVDSGNHLLIFSVGAGMVLCLFKVIAVSFRVTKPLDRMKTAALGIKEGDYTAQTGVKQSDEIGQLAAILDDMAQQLGKASDDNAEAEKRRREFIANISHELRTPITVMRSSLEALLDGVVTDPAQVAQFLREMHAESLYLERLVTDLFELARLQSTEFAIEFEEVCVRDALRDAVRTMTPIAAEKGVLLPCPDANASYYIPPIMGDYGRLKQLFIALMDNAIKFTPAGKTVSAGLTVLDGRISVVIDDEGGGIAGEDLPRIFERFYRKQSEDNHGGTGLGLPIAKEIADRHGAKIFISSEINHGTKVEIIFYEG